MHIGQGAKVNKEFQFQWANLLFIRFGQRRDFSSGFQFIFFDDDAKGNTTWLSFIYINIY